MQQEKQVLSLSSLKTLVDDLDGATQRHRKARLRGNEVQAHLISRGTHLIPTKWTQKIEEAAGQLEALQQLGLQFDEMALTYLNLQLQSHLICDTNKELSGAIGSAIWTHDHKTMVYDDGWMMPVIEAAVVRAVEELKTLPEARAPSIERSVLHRAEARLFAAFTTLSAQLKGPQRHPYPSSFAIDPEDAINQKFAETDWRNVQILQYAYNDDAANVALLAALTKLDATHRSAFEALEVLRKDVHGKGGVNERQHAARLLDMLPGDEDSESKNIQLAINQQNERRWRYELIRQNVVCAQRKLQSVREETVEALAAAVESARKSLPAKPTQETCGWRELKLHESCAMFNCLAADVHIRAAGRKLARMSKELDNDVSDQAGRRALYVQYQTVAKTYCQHDLGEPNDYR